MRIEAELKYCETDEHDNRATNALLVEQFKEQEIDVRCPYCAQRVSAWIEALQWVKEEAPFKVVKGTRQDGMLYNEITINTHDLEDTLDILKAEGR
ncbi:MAG: hypothetical protein ACXAEN_17845 [Candidatus Thorarchaeota archaeon]|jgi:hypothetical protein